MGKHAIVVLGPAGSGKSTLCRVLFDHYSALKRSVHVCNFDPAAEDLQYDASVDVRELISLDDAMEGKALGPNGGLVFCMEYLMQHASWIHDELQDYADDFLIVDMPGQVELLSHVPVVPSFVELLRQEGYFVSAVFLLDGPTATSDTGKYVSGCLLSLTTMMSIDCPFVNVLSKCDLLPPHIKNGRDMEHFENCEFDFLHTHTLPPRWRSMTRQVATIVQDFSLVRFIPMDITDEDTVTFVAQKLNELMQVDDDAEVRDSYPGDADE